MKYGLKQQTKILLVTCSLLLITACYPPVYNRHLTNAQPSISWLGEPMQKLVLHKGRPNRIYFLGDTKQSLVSSEFWAPEIDRFETLYENYGQIFNLGHHSKVNQDLYQNANSQGVWLFVYSIPIQNYQPGYKECTEYYQIDNHAIVVKSGLLTNTIGAQKLCARSHPRR